MGCNAKNSDVIRLLTGPRETDELLLAQFAAAADATAFTELVRRHGPMVLAACRRVLGAGPDADDAFQATFIVLARKAAAIQEQRSLGCWLFGVARNAALRLRDKERRRRKYETRKVPDSPAEPVDREFHDIVDEELQRLPEKYRMPLVTCLLEGQTQEDAARGMGLSLSTLRRQLQQGKDLLRGRLVRRGVVPVTTLAALCEADVSHAKAVEVARLAVNSISGGSAVPAAALAQEVIAMIARTRTRSIVAVLLIAIGFTGGGVAWQLAEAQQKPEKPMASAVPAAKPATGEKSSGGVVEDRIKPGDLLYIRAEPVFEQSPISGIYQVEASGKVVLGPTYGGRVKLEGLTLEEAEVVIQRKLLEVVKRVAVTVTRANPIEAVGLELRVRQLEQEVKNLKTAVEKLQPKPVR